MEALGQLTGGIAHDFNNLLAGIRGHLELIELESDDPALRSDVADALALLERGAGLTQQLLAYSRQRSLKPTRVDLIETLGEIHDLLRRTLGESIRIHREPGGKPIVVEVDAALLHSSILNLCINARDAMPSGGFVKQSLGHLSLESEPDRGTRVRILLPLAQPGPVEPPAENAPTSPATAPDETVLLVEDQPGVRRVTRRLLDSLGYRVLEAADGSSALELLEAGQRVDILLSDIGLPGGLTGVELAERARQLTPDIRVVLMSGYSGGPRGSQPGKTLPSRLSKPFRRTDLAAALRGETRGGGREE